jgi:hypothetical protein
VAAWPAPGLLGSSAAAAWVDPPPEKKNAPEKKAVPRKPTPRVPPARTATPADPLDAALEEIERGLDEAWRKGDQWGVSEGLSKGWDVSPHWGRETALKVIETGAPGFRPVAAAVLADRADVDTLVAATQHLDERKFPDERRLFVRRLGKASKEEHDKAAREAGLFLLDKDHGVKMAAVGSIADLGDVSLLEPVLARLGEVPSQREHPQENDQGLVDTAVYGALRTLAGLRPVRSSEVGEWWRSGGVPLENKDEQRPDDSKEGKGENPDDDSGAAKPLAEIKEGRRGGRLYYLTPSFDLYYRIGTSEEAPTGELSVRAWSRSAERSVKRAVDAAEPILGRMHLPVVRLYLADERNFPPLGGRSNFGGHASGNEVVLRLDRVQALSSNLVHEYVHVMHLASYQDQPRWMAEGLAESLTRSGDKTTWSGARVTHQGLDKEVDKGAFTQSVQWDAGGSGDNREAIRYALSYLCIDYLRFGGFAAPSERLAFLMGRLERHETPARALEQLYGVSVKELDERVKAWVRGM